jgi:hypothetical protein
MKRFTRYWAITIVALMFSVGCAGPVYVRTAPPPPKVEVKPARPGPTAVWIDGHWKWSRNRYVWVAGHWEKNPRGAWVPGRWEKRARGHVWVPGHWRR